MRSDKIFKNSISALLNNYCVMFFRFICRIIFVKTLGKSYLGVNGLFTDIFSLLSLMELGAGSALTYFYYEPLVNKDRQKIALINQVYKRLYIMIGVAISIVGIALVPFLDRIVNSTEEIPNLTMIYILMLADVASTYFFSYRKTLLDADQKSYVAYYADMWFSLILNIVQIIVLLITHNYLLYLTLVILKNVCYNIWINSYVLKNYHYIVEYDDKPSTQLLIDVGKKIAASFSHKIGTVVVYGTDNLLINYFVNVQTVGIYSNYRMIQNMVLSPVIKVIQNMVATVGEVRYQENEEKGEQEFIRIKFLSHWLFGFVAVCFFITASTFIEWLFGADYTVDAAVVLFVSINAYLTGIDSVPGMFTQSSGLFWNTRKKPIAESIINLVASLLLGHVYGLIGVLMGTVISALTTSFWYDAYVLYKHWFKKSYYGFIRLTAIYIMQTLIMTVLLCLICNKISCQGIAGFVIKVLIVVVVYNGGFFIMNRRNEGLIYIKNTFLRILNHVLDSIKKRK